MKQRVFAIVGWKNSGKTGLMERLVSDLTARGLSISTIKHAHHGFDIDREGADSFRHRQAGANEVAIVSGSRYAIMHELRNAPEPALDEIVDRMSPCDLILIEGFKQEAVPKIETRRQEAHRQQFLADQDPLVVAIAADHSVSTALPVFDLDDTRSIADFILSYLKLV